MYFRIDIIRLLNGLFGLLLCLSAHSNDVLPPQVSATAESKPIITMAFYDDPNHNFYFKFAELLYTDAFSRLGYDFTYQVVPAIRASIMADTGKVDGEPGRVFDYADKYQNLIRIEEPIFEDDLHTYFVDPTISIKHWDDLNNTHYKVEYYRGIFRAEQKLKHLIPKDNLTTSSYPLSSLRKLQHNRIDIYIDSKVGTSSLLTLPEFSSKPILAGASLEQANIYCYLHKRHAKLAPTLVATFKQMKQEGLIEHYFIQARNLMKE